jgi:hypothetical protein
MDHYLVMPPLSTSYNITNTSPPHPLLGTHAFTPSAHTIATPTPVKMHSRANLEESYDGSEVKHGVKTIFAMMKSLVYKRLLSLRIQ